MKPFLNACNPYITLACIVSCALCTIVMIWGVYAMRSDMESMRVMMTPMNSSKESIDPMIAHCQSMPEMAGCERYR